MADEKLEIDWGNDKLFKAQKQIEENQYDLEAWSLLVREAQGKWIDDVRPLFEKLVTTFPSTGRYWKIYIEQEMKARHFEKVEKLFQRCLMKVLNIDLWKLYLAYVKETKSILPSYKEKMAQAYDFALDKIGMDIQSYAIWNDYVNFLKAVEAVGSYAENQKISAVRKVYQRGVVNPMVNIEQFWKDYMTFEQNINPIIAEKMAMERSRDYMNARRVTKEFEAVTRGLNRNSPSVPPTGQTEELKQVDLWKKYIAAREDVRSRYHVFVAAALMEYYCSKDKNIAFRIFELGLKKFSDNPDYILCYIDYLSHLNEDNNTRVLFERVLSSGSLEPEKSVEIWNRFLEFESNIGDLASIVKVEKRRSAVLEQIKEFEGKETAQLVDRYKFQNLYPCSAAELKSIGYNEVAKTSVKSFHPLSSGVLLETEEETNHIPRPDFSQMIPFKPKAQAVPGDHPVPGGIFPHPPAVAQLCTLLPPPDCFHGPFVSVDSIMDIFNKIQLPDTPPLPSGDNDNDVKLFDLAKSIHWIVDDSQDGSISVPPNLNTQKRRRRALNDRSMMDDSEDDDLAGAPPVNDIYRARQQKRVK
uniref:(California timema) hypothetical protein n=1 Tax=Timema californicum TaxID=61474 RepID=A0A7R9IYU0_TIMCA|nr:unnamed protein product [Timema californicum]